MFEYCVELSHFGTTNIANSANLHAFPEGYQRETQVDIVIRSIYLNYHNFFP
jgi:hypothetical protein